MNRIQKQPRRKNSVNSVNSVTKIRRLVPALLDWFSKNARDLPWRRTSDPYAIWVSEIMLQQTQVKTVIPYWNRWMKELPTIESLAGAKTDNVLKLWEGLGYYHRARNLQKAAQEIKRSAGLHETRDSQSPSLRFPENFDSILALPGIGRYTAGAISSIAFNQPTPILDGNVIRVLTRIFGIRKNAREKKNNALLWQLAGQLVLNAKLETKNSNCCCSHLNQSLMELGALVCTPRQPGCPVCPINKLCVANQNNLTDRIPDLGKRRAATARHFAAFVVENNGRFLVRRRPHGVVNAGLWEFPNVELLNGSKAHDTAHSVFNSSAEALKPLCTIHHSITRYRISLSAYRIHGPSPETRMSGAWKTLSQLEQLSFPSAHRKILERLR